MIPQLGAGGAEAVVLALTEDALQAGHKVLAASAGGFRVAELGRLGVAHEQVRLVGRRPADLLASVRRLRQVGRRWRPDLVHAHNVKAAAVARAAVGRRVPILVTVHGVPDEEYAGAARVLRRVAGRVVAVSGDVADRLVAEGFPADRVDVVENAVVPPRVHPRAASRRDLALPEDAPVVSCIARLVPQKRHDLLLEAWAGVEQGVLLVVGDGPNRQDLERRAQRLGLTDRVRFLGERDDVDRILAATDCSVLSTDWEGLPISVLEAMAVGVPVIATAVGALPEVLGEVAVLVPPGDAPALGAALRSLLADEARRAALAARGRALVADRFGPDRMGMDYRARYDALVRRSPRRELVP
ncbi:MAG: glycosyltransferase [Marmoricola sp.]